MGDCFKTPVIFIAIFFVVLAFIFTQYSKNEGFHLLHHFNRSAAPYYTTTFQAYPGKYMNYSSDRNSQCLQQHQQYEGYRNCMLYLQ